MPQLPTGKTSLSKQNPKQRSSKKSARKNASAKSAVESSVPFWRRLSRNHLSIGFALILICGVVGALVYANSRNQSTLPDDYVIGSVQYCINDSQFMTLFGFPGGGVLDTRARYGQGLWLRELDENGRIVRSYQHPSWTRAGYLGAFQRDDSGNVYLIPSPFISLLDNPVEKANILYRIDSRTGVMQPLVDLPALAPASPQNPYGLMDVTYDCDTHSLYVSSVFGSTYDQVAGTIFQIDPDTGEIKSTLERIDAFGLGVFNGVNGKRLYFGLARSPEIMSVALDENGGFTQDFRSELSLLNQGFHRSEQAQSITFRGENQMVVRTTQFNFNLVAPTETRQTLLSYIYSSQQDVWLLTGSQISNE
jgi:hypothetical protein